MGVLPRVTVGKVSLPGGALKNSQGKPIGVSGKSLVSVLGIQLGSATPSPEVARKVTTTGTKSTRKSTESALVTKPKTAKPTKTTVPPLLISPTNPSTQSVAFPITVKSKTTLSLSKVAAWVLGRGRLF